eukprot:GDKJ01032416.1.p1 GENE.GDKJ01032416.1~~GDKJ01032416.1.p1  ORF type:complete len:1526 (-),score=365.74 GDKJ01032416.1:45-4298(-)
MYIKCLVDGEKSIQMPFFNFNNMASVVFALCQENEIFVNLIEHSGSLSVHQKKFHSTIESLLMILSSISVVSNIPFEASSSRRSPLFPSIPRKILINFSASPPPYESSLLDYILEYVVRRDISKDSSSAGMYFLRAVKVVSRVSVTSDTLSFCDVASDVSVEDENKRILSSSSTPIPQPQISSSLSSSNSELPPKRLLSIALMNLESLLLQICDVTGRLSDPQASTARCFLNFVIRQKRKILSRPLVSSLEHMRMVLKMKYNAQTVNISTRDKLAVLDGLLFKCRDVNNTAGGLCSAPPSSSKQSPPIDSTSGQPPIVVLFGPNAAFMETGNDWLDLYLRDVGCDVLIVNYRGYGRSTGRPSPRVCANDAECIVYDYVINQMGYQKVGVHGRSIGGVAASAACVVEGCEQVLDWVVIDRSLGSLDIVASSLVGWFAASILYMLGVRADNASAVLAQGLFGNKQSGGGGYKVFIFDADDHIIKDSASMKVGVASRCFGVHPVSGFLLRNQIAASRKEECDRKALAETVANSTVSNGYSPLMHRRNSGSSSGDGEETRHHHVNDAHQILNTTAHPAMSNDELLDFASPKAGLKPSRFDPAVRSLPSLSPLRDGASSPLFKEEGVVPPVTFGAKLKKLIAMTSTAKSTPSSRLDTFYSFKSTPLAQGERRQVSAFGDSPFFVNQDEKSNSRPDLPLLKNQNTTLVSSSPSNSDDVIGALSNEYLVKKNFFPNAAGEGGETETTALDVGSASPVSSVPNRSSPPEKDKMDLATRNVIDTETGRSPLARRLPVPSHSEDNTTPPIIKLISSCRAPHVLARLHDLENAARSMHKALCRLDDLGVFNLLPCGEVFGIGCLDNQLECYLPSSKEGVSRRASKLFALEQRRGKSIRSSVFWVEKLKAQDPNCLFFEDLINLSSSNQQPMHNSSCPPSNRVDPRTVTSFTSLTGSDDDLVLSSGRSLDDEPPSLLERAGIISTLLPPLKHVPSAKAAMAEKTFDDAQVVQFLLEDEAGVKYFKKTRKRKLPYAMTFDSKDVVHSIHSLLKQQSKAQLSPDACFKPVVSSFTHIYAGEVGKFISSTKSLRLCASPPSPLVNASALPESTLKTHVERRLEFETSFWSVIASALRIPCMASRSLLSEIFDFSADDEGRKGFSQLKRDETATVNAILSLACCGALFGSETLSGQGEGGSALWTLPVDVRNLPIMASPLLTLSAMLQKVNTEMSKLNTSASSSASSDKDSCLSAEQLINLVGRQGLFKPATTHNISVDENISTCRARCVYLSQLALAKCEKDFQSLFPLAVSRGCLSAALSNINLGNNAELNLEFSAALSGNRESGELIKEDVIFAFLHSQLKEIVHFSRLLHAFLVDASLAVEDGLHRNQMARVIGVTLRVGCGHNGTVNEKEEGMLLAHAKNAKFGLNFQ